MRKKLFTISVLLVFLLVSCKASKEEISIFSFSFDADGNYMGFDTVPENYTVEQAIKDGCYVMKDSSEYGGNNSWQNFIANSKAGNNSNIRIMLVFDEGTYYCDLFYIDGYYRIFDSSAENLADNKSKYLLELYGHLPNAARDSYFVVLTDDGGLSFGDVSTAMLSSSMEAINSISPFRIVIMGVVQMPN